MKAMGEKQGMESRSDESRKGDQWGIEQAINHQVCSSFSRGGCNYLKEWGSEHDINTKNLRSLSFAMLVVM